LPSKQLAAVVVDTYAQLHASQPETKMAFLAVPMAIASLEEPRLGVTEAEEMLLRGAARALLASPLYVSLKR
jgi:hypothetical protein